MKIATFSVIDDIDAGQWNALARGRYPFVRHEFLAAMERHGCVGESSGWIPRHLGCFDGDELVGAMPLYEKHNSWGEFVFDHAWAEAFHRAGLAYYPKLVNAIPFTPATGQRVLVRDDGRGFETTIAAKLVDGMRELMRRGNFSGAHSLFVAPRQFEQLNIRGALSRLDCQFHWHNRGYRDFDDFLSTLKAKKRKNIRQERTRVAQAGVTVRRLDGHTATAQDWRDFTSMYRAIYNRKYGYPAFNLNFFRAVADAMPEQVQLVLAQRDGDGEHPIAAALMYLDDDTLYGRHWGCREMVDCLHFEVCYYQGIELCIERGLRRFDPGAQGEHKIARGFSPTPTRSLHYLAEPAFADAVARFVGHETSGVERYIDAVKRHSPYHADAACEQL